MRYYQLTLHTSSEAVEAVSDRFFTLFEELEIADGGVEILDPNDLLNQEKTPASWDYIDEDLLGSLSQEALVRTYYSEELLARLGGEEGLKKRVHELLSDLSAYFDCGSLEMEISLTDEDQYLYAWMENYKPFRVGRHLLIIPSGHVEEPLEGDLVLHIDPGLAFGTGTHETTSLCMEFLEDIVKPGDLVYDIGCGSGILGLAAAKLGASRVIMSDIDPMAVQVASENIIINHEEAKVLCYEGDLLEIPAFFEDRQISRKADIIVANIIADVIMILAKRILPFLKDDGYFVASGILREREHEVEACLLDAGFELLGVKEKGSWVSLLLRKRHA